MEDRKKGLSDSHFLSGIVITKNEERNICGCLDSLKWVDEIIVVDAESTDSTVVKAKEFTDKIFVKPWEGFGPQKNFAIEQAQGDWIFILDADERVTAGLKDEIRSLLENGSEPRIAGYRVPRRNFFYGQWMQYGGMFPDPQVRLFRNDGSRYDDTLLHENLVLKGDVADLQGFLDHYSVPTITHHLRKMIQYTSLSAREKLKTLHAVTFLNLFGHHVWTIIKTLVLRQGWKDGVHGLIAATFAGFHTFAKYAKAYEILENNGESELMHQSRQSRS